MISPRHLGIVLLLPAFFPLLIPAQDFPAVPDVSRHLAGLKKLVEIRDSVRDVRPFLGKLYPLAVVVDGHYLIFDVDAGGIAYVFIKSAPAPDTLPKGIRAAFPLDVYDGRMACVVSPDALDATEGFVLILHEFIHCAQWDCCEPELKGKLGIAREAMEKRDFMWELQYRFPYGDPEVTKAYASFMKAAREGGAKAADASRRKLRKLLKTPEFEYMAWEEYKEGFARYIENMIRRRLTFPENRSGGEMFLTRIAFYEGGASYIALLCRKDPALCADLPRLFFKIMGQSPGGSPQ